jgi:prepilin-type N-terminal cleavage/methylation domain-containing protein
VRFLRKTAQFRFDRNNLQTQNSGFTLVELLVVIAIIAILAAIVLLVINPIELTRQTRDATRLTELTTLQNAINVAVQEATNSGAQILCVNTTAPCSGTSTPGTAANRNANGSGWVKVNLGSSQSVSVPTLPADPINNATLNYDYGTNAAGDKWEINAVLESTKYSPKMTTDGGNNDAVYEVGSDLTIIN